MIRELDTSRIADLKGLSPEHLERRRSYITASDFPALLGIDPYRGPQDVYFDKLGVLLPESKGTMPAGLGTGLEPAILDLAETALDVPIIDRGRWYTKGVIGATVDGRADVRRAVCNAKSSGKAEDYVDGPPARVVVQAQVEMLCTEDPIAYIPVLLPPEFRGPLQFRLFEIEFDAKLANDLMTTGMSFMDNYVAKQKMPPGEPAQLDTLRRIRRTPNQIVTVDPALMAAWTAARDARLAVDAQVKAAKEVEERALRSLLAAMGEAEGAECPEGVFTYLEQTRKGYTVEPATFRVARFKARITEEVSR